MFTPDSVDETAWFPSEFDRELLGAGIDPAVSFRPPDARDVVHELAHTLQIARVQLLDAVIAWDRADDHLLDGARSATAWLRHHLRVSNANASVLLTQARGLRDTPRIRQALVCGELSFDQADQLVRVFTEPRAAYVDRDVDMLIDHVAGMSVARCRMVAQHWAARVDAEAVENGDEVPHPPDPTVSELHLGEILDGDTVLEGTFNAADASVVRAAIAAAHRLGQPDMTTDDETLEDETSDNADNADKADSADNADNADKADGPVDTRTPAQQRADAFVLIAQFFLDHHDHLAKDGGGSINRAHVNIHVNLDAFTTKHLTGNSFSPYDVSGLDLAAILQTCCDASVTRILTAGASLTLDIGRETRVVSPTLRKAVITRDRTCRFPGCDMPAWFTDVHHIDHWIRGGATDRENCCLLCRRHHTLVHKGGWTVTGNPNADLYFTGPEGIAHRSRPPNPQLPLRSVAAQEPGWN